MRTEVVEPQTTAAALWNAIGSNMRMFRGLGFRAEGLGFRVWGRGIGVYRVWGRGFRA